MHLLDVSYCSSLQHIFFVQDTITKEGLKSNRTPHTFSSPIPKNNYNAPNHEVQVCKTCHGPDRNELVIKDLLFLISNHRNLFMNGLVTMLSVIVRL